MFSFGSNMSTHPKVLIDIIKEPSNNYNAFEEKLKLISTNKANNLLNIKDEYYNTLLHISTLYKKYDYIKLLLTNYGFTKKINIKNDYGETPYSIAVKTQQFNIIELFNDSIINEKINILTEDKINLLNINLKLNDNVKKLNETKKRLHTEIDNMNKIYDDLENDKKTLKYNISNLQEKYNINIDILNEVKERNEQLTKKNKELQKSVNTLINMQKK
jgi:ankyrin repeat protein